MGKKKRLDVILVEKGLVESREKAKRLIMAGKVIVNNEKIDKPGKMIDENVDIRVKEGEKYVSRGGYKIEGAWKTFRFEIKDKVVCDIGASTGGFTDFLLQNGARKVYCVDVGYGQLHWKIRNDPKVVVMERTNARDLELEEKVDLVVCDVSFISLKNIFSTIKRILKPKGVAIVLVKPQFEAGRENVGKGGIVRTKEVHKKVLYDIIKNAIEIGLCPKNLDFSKIKGTDGNIEFFLELFNESCNDENIFNKVEEVVNKAWEELS